jgi:integrase
MQARETDRRERAVKLAEGVPASSLPAVSPEVPHRRGGEIGINRHLEVIRRLVNFAILRGYLESNPFVRHGKRIVRFAPEKPRTRRLLPGEEEQLLRAASRNLQALIIAALETGCRKGELLSLQVRDVICNEKGEPRTLSLRAENTKTDTARTVPVSPRLRAILEMRRLGPDGLPLGSDAYVFGNDVGDRISEFKLAWRGACKRARITGLTFHDLRREHGSRLVEGGVNLLTVSRLLGHKRVSTTDTYLKASEGVAERELARYHERRLAAAAVDSVPSDADGQ